MNKAILIGRLAADPEINTTSGGKKYARYRLAVDRQTKADGKQTTDFIPCVTWDKGADFAERYLSKGMKIAVEGRIQTGSYEKDGVKHYTTDIVVDRHEFCESKGSGGHAAPSAWGQPPQHLGQPAYTPPSAYGQWGQPPAKPQAPAHDFERITGEEKLPF